MTGRQWGWCWRGERGNGEVAGRRWEAMGEVMGEVTER